MPTKFLTTAAAMAVLAAFAVPALAQDAALDPQAEAGKLIFEKTAGGVGCAMCHGETAEGDIGPAIQGADPAAIRSQLDSNEQMTFISLSDEEIEQVSVYLRYLHDQAAH